MIPRGVAEALSARLQELETALLPFARQGYMMGSVRIDLDARGQTTVSVGGAWLLAGDSTRVEHCEKNFFGAVDAIGRDRVQRMLACIAEKQIAATKAQEERDNTEATSH